MRQRFLIVCEGETEANYFDALKLHRRMTSVVVKALRAKSSDPALIVKQATERSANEHWDQVWCVFDIEAPPKPSSVRSIYDAQEAGHHVAWSNPCFEVWLLLHFQPTAPPFETSASVGAALRHHMPDFKKAAAVSAALLDLAETAATRSGLISDRHLRDAVGPPDDNPNTLVGTLVHELLRYAS